MSATFCQEFYINHWGQLQLWIIPSISLLQCFLLSIVVYLSKKQILRASHDEEAGMMTHEHNTSLIFPVYIRLLWLCALAEFLEGVLTIFVAKTGFAFFPNEGGNTLQISLVVGAICMVYRSIIEGLTVMLLMQGMGSKTLRLAGFVAIVSSGMTWSGKTMYFYYANSDIELILNGLYLLFYVVISASSFCAVGRPALRRFALFFSFYHGLICIVDLLHASQKDYDAMYCIYPSTTMIFLLVFPWLCYITLRADSKFWQGLAGDPSVVGTSFSTDVQGPLSGICLAPDTASMVASTMDTLNAVPLLNFALLRIDRTKTVKHQQVETSQVVVLGAGGNSRVFQGKYNGRPVAIKMLFSPQLTPAVVATFCREAATLGTLKHPNVVEIIGICISPPSVSLVMELCDGTLFDLLHSSGEQLDWETQLRLAYECALAVDYLHSQSPPVLHLDIKSPNFLLSRYGQIKIADLELSRRGRESTLGKAVLPDTLNWTAPEALLVKGGKVVVYDEKTDVYSLGCVLWEIIHGQVPYQGFLEEIRRTPDKKDRLKASFKSESDSEPIILSDYKADSQPSTLNDRSPLLRNKSHRLAVNPHAEEILATYIIEQTYRPPISPATHPEMARIISQAWHSDPQLRPSASDIVKALSRLRFTIKEDSEQIRKRQSEHP